MGKKIFKSFVASCLALFVGALMSRTWDDFLLPIFNGLDVDYFAVIAISLLVILNTIIFYITFSESESRARVQMKKFSMDKLDSYCANFDEAYAVESAESKYENIRDEYLYFSKFWQYAFIKSDYIIDTGNFQTCNRALLYSIEDRINDHPILWKLFRWIFAV